MERSVIAAGLASIFVAMAFAWSAPGRAHEAREVPGDAGVAGASVEIVIERTLVDGAPESLVVPQGSRVRLILHGDTEMELHLHGYDLTAVVRPGSPAVFTFTAVHTGRFAVVAHDDGGLLEPREVARAYIEVHPV